MWVIFIVRSCRAISYIPTESSDGVSEGVSDGAGC